MDDPVRSSLDAAFPDRAVQGVERAGVSWNELNRTVRVDFADGEECYLKVSLSGDRTRIARESAVIRYVGATSPVPVAAVLASDPDADPPYLATAPLEGRNVAFAWDEARRSDGCRAERERLAAALGRGLARLHEYRFDEHGHVVGGDAEGLDLDTAPWTGVLVDTLSDLRRFPDTDDFVDVFDDVIGAIEANRDLLDPAPAALLHGDVAKPNCVLVDGEVGFVDWETSHVGDPVRDVCRAAWHGRGVSPDADREWVVEAIHAGYRERAGSLPVGFEERRPVYDAVHCLLYVTIAGKMAEHVGMDPADFATWVREEAERRLANL